MSKTQPRTDRPERQRFFRVLHASMVCAIVVGAFAGNATAGPAEASALHWAQWDSALARSQDDPAVLYGFYAYRTIAVPNPEIYLRADSVFLDIIGHIPGSSAAYRGANVRDLEFYRRLKRREGRGASFSILVWSPELDSVDDRGVVPDGISWLDRRLPSAAVLLHGPVERLSTAEAAALRYAQYRRSGASTDSVFVIIDTAGTGYYAIGARVFSPSRSQPLTDLSEIAPTLVFNERAVFYPMLGRDDRERSPGLMHLVSRLGAPGVPSLSSEDHGRIELLREVAALHGEVPQRMATLIASGAADASDSAVAAAWGIPKADSLNEIGLLVHGMVRRATYRADHLSLRAAQMAFPLINHAFDSTAESLSDKYLEACGRPVIQKDTKSTSIEAGGCIWSYELLDVPFDDFVRIRTGQPSSQALAMASILDMAEIPNFCVGIDFGQGTKPDEHWVITDDGNWQFNLGHWARVLEPNMTAMKRPINVRSCGTRDAWVGLGETHPVGDTDVIGVTAMLSRFEAAQPNLLLRAPAVDRSWHGMTEFIDRLINGYTAIQPLPWTDHGDRR